jgi:hypothetical protein
MVRLMHLYLDFDHTTSKGRFVVGIYIMKSIKCSLTGIP